MDGATQDDKSQKSDTSQISLLSNDFEEEEVQSEFEDEDLDMYTELLTDSEFEKDFEPVPGLSGTSNTDLPMVKYPFQLKRTETGNILTVHHTITSANQALRVRIAACCFNEQSNKFVVIDRRGNIYVFDFVIKRYWRVGFCLPNATVLHASPLHRNEYVVANDMGHVFIINVETSVICRRNEIGDAAVHQITWGNRLRISNASNVLVRFGYEAVLINLKSLLVSHQLHFDQSRCTLKFASFLPNSDQFFTCFTNDTIHTWSTVTLQTVHITQPIKVRDRKLRLSSADSIPEIVLRCREDDDGSDMDEQLFDCEEQHFADGKIIACRFSPNGNRLCLSTVDGYLMMLGTVSFELEKLYRLRDFVIKELVMLPQPKDRILFAITGRGEAIMLDLEQTESKLIVQHSKASSLSVSRDGKLLSILSKCGEVNVWLTCRLYSSLHTKTNSILKLSAALKLPKMPAPTCGVITPELRQLLKRDRLQSMIREFGCYPEKYRFIIWSSLLELPCNFKQFQELLKLGQSTVISRKTRGLNIKNDAQRRAIVKVWSCLAHWCKVFAYADFMPHFIYPFVKQLSKNSMIVFELLVSLLLNHLQLCFEFHPLPPENYLAMCDNILQQHDQQLCKFYGAMEVKAKDYAWSLVANAFSEVLEEQQWLELWDNIISEPPYFIIFVIVAYNLLHREVILRLPDKNAVIGFFHDQNPIDVAKLIARAHKLMSKCAPGVHPQRFIPPFEPIPKGVYPKFLKYPSDWIAQQEDQAATLQKQQEDIEARIRHLEMEEVELVERLQNGLKQEEHTRRVKEMEKLYQETIQHEEQRIACHRKMLLTYQLEVRQRKSEVMAKLQESEQRRKLMEMEKDIDGLMHSIERQRRHHNQELLFAEDDVRNQEMELLAQQYYADTGGAPLAQKYYDNIQRMCQQRDVLQQKLREMTRERLQVPKPSTSSFQTEPHLRDIELSIMEIQREFSDILKSDSNSSKS